MTCVIEITNQIRGGGLSWEELSDYSRHSNMSVRGSAIYQISDQYGDENRTAFKLAELASGYDSMEPVMGTIRLGHICIKLLNAIDAPVSQQLYQELLSSWPDHDRDDLNWFVKTG